MIIAILAMLIQLLSLGTNASDSIANGPWIQIVTPEMHDDQEWSKFHADAVAEYEDEFTAIFNSLTATSKRSDKGLRVTVKRENGKLARSYTVKGK
jgi:hypothetical protein